jgi:hypothetical protein
MVVEIAGKQRGEALKRRLSFIVALFYKVGL